MIVETARFTPETAHIFHNLYPLYLHDLSEFDAAAPNEHGVLEPAPVRTLQEQMQGHKGWLETPNSLFPFLIRADGIPAGFDLIATHPHIPKHIDYLVHEFFLLHAFRGKGVGEQAAAQVFDRFRGKWEIYAMPNNPRAQGFWRKAIVGYTGSQYQEERSPTLFGPEHVIFRFSNLLPMEGAD